MGIHGDDVALTMRNALVDQEIAPTMSQLRFAGDGETGWPNRDGKITFECVGRDWFRGFRVTVEVVDQTEMTWDFQDGDWD